MRLLQLILTFLALLGLIDDLRGDRWGLAQPFENGLATMGRLLVGTVGFYCIGITLVQNNAEAISGLTRGLPFDPSLLVSCLLCSDAGGLPVAQAMAATPALGIFTGALVASGFGMTIGYQLPVFLSATSRSDLPILMRGFAYGIITLPAGLIAGGLLLDLTPYQLFINTLPVLILCILLISLMFRVPEPTVAVLTVLAKLIRLLSYVLFGMVVVFLFVPEISFVDRQLIYEILYANFRTMTIVCGGLVLSKLLIRHLRPLLRRAAKILPVNESALLGLILGLVHSMTMIPMLPDMDRKGKILNAAEAVCAGYLLGGQMAFVSQLIPPSAMPAYFVNKIVAGVSAIALALWMERRFERKAEKASAG